MRTRRILIITALLALAVPAPTAHAGGAVTVCDEAHLLAALADGGTVTFACSGTITLTDTITIVAYTTIDGSGQEVTISSNGAVRVFTVNAGATLNLNWLTVTNGWADDGGGVYNGGTLVVSHCAFTGNDAYNTDDFASGGAIFNAGSANLSDSILTGNSASGANGSGGAIANAGTLIVRRSAFSNNDAQDFGGAIVGSDLTVSDSTFGGNSAPVGGAICSSNHVESCIYEGSNVNGGDNLTVNNSSFFDNNASVGGGIYFLGNASARLTLSDSAFSNNSANWGGSSISYGSATVSNCAFSHNHATGDGGAVLVHGAATVSNSAFVDNSAYDGGAIWSDDTLAVSNSVFTGNSAYGGEFGVGGAISNSGTLAVSHSTFTGNSAQDFGGAIIGNDLNVINSTFMVNSAPVGGAIRGSGLVDGCTFTSNTGGEGGAIMGGNLTVRTSKFGNNSADYGGAIYGGGLTISDSTFTSNRSHYDGGAVFAIYDLTVDGSTFITNSADFAGGGIYASSATISNSTFVENDAYRGGGIYKISLDALNMGNSTLSGNSADDGGGIYTAGGALTLKNTIVAHSPAGGNCSGTITDGGGNVSYPDMACPGVNADPLLGPLQDNGGPTWTMALGEGSAALNAGIDLTCITAPVNGLDQRGVMRPQGTHCDSGSVEQMQTPAAPTLVGVCDEAHLRAALAGGGTVMFACSGEILLTAEIVIAANTTIDGSGQDVTISGNHAVRVFHVNPGNTLIVNGLMVADGSSPSGGGIYSDTGAVIVSHSVFSGHGDGAIVNEDGMLTVSHSTFSANDGRSISNYGSEARLMVSDSHFSGNRGGGILNYGIDATMNVANSTFVGNTTSGEGGGIYNAWGGVLTVSDSTFSSNIAGQGGGIHSYGNVTVSNCTFSSNSAGNGGGAIVSMDSLLTVHNSTFYGNDATHGGAISGNSGGIAISNSTFSGNHAIDGGAIHNAGGLTVSNSTFSGNRAASVGAIHIPGGRATLKNTAVANNLGESNCGGIIVDGGGNLSYPDTSCPGINADPLLGPLQDNGGSTWTMALGEGSAALDAADDAICAAPPVNNLDQRGFVRPWGAHCDIGAVEQVQEPAAVRLNAITAGSAPGAVSPTLLAGLLLVALAGFGVYHRRDTERSR